MEAGWAWPTAPTGGPSRADGILRNKPPNGGRLGLTHRSKLGGRHTYVTELIYYGFYDLLCPCVEDPETGPFPLWEDLEGSVAKQENVNRREGLNNTQAEKCA